jgi:hypothetical protein
MAIPFVDICLSDQNLSLKIQNFDTKDSECKATLQNLSTPLDYFQLFVPEFLVNFIVEETNNYQNFVKRKRH